MEISIVIPTSNSAATISDTLESVLSQTHKDWELIIQDGLSQDETLSVVRRYEPLFGEKMHVFSEKDEGLYDAMNRGIAHATGNVIGILNSDDFYHDEHVLEDINRYFVIMRMGERAITALETSYAVTGISYVLCKEMALSLLHFSSYASWFQNYGPQSVAHCI